MQGLSELSIQESCSARLQRATEFWASARVSASSNSRGPVVCPVILLGSLHGASCGGVMGEGQGQVSGKRDRNQGCLSLHPSLCDGGPQDRTHSSEPTPTAPPYPRSRVPSEIPSSVGHKGSTRAGTEAAPRVTDTHSGEWGMDSHRERSRTHTAVPQQSPHVPTLTCSFRHSARAMRFCTCQGKTWLWVRGKRGLQLSLSLLLPLSRTL